MEFYFYSELEQKSVPISFLPIPQSFWVPNGTNQLLLKVRDHRPVQRGREPADSARTRPGAGGVAPSVGDRGTETLGTLSDTPPLRSFSPQKTHNKHLKSKYKRVLSKTNRNKKASVLTKQETMDFQRKTPRLYSVLLPPHQSFYRNSCARAKKPLKHTQYIYRYSYVYVYIYNIYKFLFK